MENYKSEKWNVYVQKKKKIVIITDIKQKKGFA